MGAAVNLMPLYGRSPQGERVYGAKPTAPGKRIRTLGALGLTGLKTALCFEGTLTGAVFLQFLDQFLMPLLQPGQIVILDNAKAHGVASNSHFGGALAGLGSGRRVREAAQHENEQRVPTVEA
jgi:membrane associated rhomboid family serine protease